MSDKQWNTEYDRRSVLKDTLMDPRLRQVAMDTGIIVGGAYMTTKARDPKARAWLVRKAAATFPKSRFLRRQRAKVTARGMFDGYRNDYAEKHAVLKTPNGGSVDLKKDLKFPEELKRGWRRFRG